MIMKQPFLFIAYRATEQCSIAVYYVYIKVYKRMIRNHEMRKNFCHKYNGQSDVSQQRCSSKLIWADYDDDVEQNVAPLLYKRLEERGGCSIEPTIQF